MIALLLLVRTERLVNMVCRPSPVLVLLVIRVPTVLSTSMIVGIHLVVMVRLVSMVSTRTVVHVPMGTLVPTAL